uniref:THAP domain-containing protein 1 n=1 Tax=Oryzias latipes TaxID=8090 RepID=A0A3P9K1G2_ORYLA
QPNFHCCVPKCSVTAKCISFVSLHNFPKDGDICKKWVIHYQRDPFEKTDHTRVCSRHFVPEDLINARLDIGMGKEGRNAPKRNHRR